MKTLEQIALKPNERAAIQAAAATLREHLPVSQVILLGSKARGDDQEDSDVDLLLLTDRPLGWNEQEKVTSLLSPLQCMDDVTFGPIDIPKEDRYQGICQVLPLRTEVGRDGAVA